MRDIVSDTKIETAARKTGKVSVYVRPHDNILSTEPMISSTRNGLQGKIAEIWDQESIVRLKINAEIEFLVQIINRSFTEMNLNLGGAVYVAFEASSVHVI